MLFQTVLKISRHQSKLGTFAQVSPDTLSSENLVCRVCDFLLSTGPKEEAAPQTWHHSCCPCTVQDSCPTGGKNLSPQGPIPPRSNRVQGRTHSVKARALGPVEPKLSGQPEILRCPQPSSHICAHSCTPLALSSPSSVFPQCLKALVPAVPALFPCTQLRPRAQLQTRTPQRSAVTKHSLGSTPALPTQPRS